MQPNRPPSLPGGETHYAGHRFRSRIEAQTAVLLDHLRARWAYERQDHQTSAGRRLLDFRVELGLARHGGTRWLWVECKNEWEELDPRHEAFVCETGEPLLILRGIPRDYATQRDHLELLYAPELAPTEVRSTRPPGLQAYPGGPRGVELDLDWPQVGADPALIDAACAAARSARFEFGEQGAPCCATAPPTTTPVRPPWGEPGDWLNDPIPNEVAALTGRGAGPARVLYRMLRELGGFDGLTMAQMRRVIQEIDGRELNRGTFYAALTLLRDKKLVAQGSTADRWIIADPPPLTPPTPLRPPWERPA